MRRLPIATWLAALGALGVFALSGCRIGTQAAGAANQSAGPQPIVVAVAAAREQTLVRTAEEQGALFPKERTVIASEVSGAVAEVLADFGDSVAAGQPLLKINPREYQLRVDSSRAALDQARARFENAQAEFGRAVQLRRENMMSQAQFDSAQAALSVTRADAEAAEKALRLADKKLDDTIVKAPFAGFVQKRLISLGEYVNPGDKLCELIASDPIKLRVPLPERFVPLIGVGLKIELGVDAAPGKSYTGRITRVAPALDETSRTLLVEAEVPNADGSLRPGYFAHVRVSLGQDRALFVPERAVVRYAGVERVFVVEGGVARSREVVTGATLGDQIEISKGLKAGEYVITTDIDRLADGVPVTPREQS